MMEKKQPITYAIIRFQPHVETEEFANVGIVLMAEHSGYLDFRVETRRIGRITGFFEALDPSLVRTILKSCDAELRRVRDLAGLRGNGQTRFTVSPGDTAGHLFNALTKRREGVIRFSDARFGMHEDPERKITELFDHYVRRNFANPIYQERLLEIHIRQLMTERKIARNFLTRIYSDGLYTARFPFVENENGRDKSVLKPLFLGQNDPTKILDHGNKWIFTVNRLRKLLPDEIRFAVQGPTEPGPRLEAFRESVDAFRREEVEVFDADSDISILAPLAPANDPLGVQRH